MTDDDITNEERAADGHALLLLQRDICRCIAQFDDDLPTKRPIAKGERHELIVDILANLMHAHGDPVDFDAAILSAKLHHQEETASDAERTAFLQSIKIGSTVWWDDIDDGKCSGPRVVAGTSPFEVAENTVLMFEDGTEGFVHECRPLPPRQDRPDPVTEEGLRSLPRGSLRSFQLSEGIRVHLWMNDGDTRDPREAWEEQLRSCIQKPSGGTKES